MRKTALLLVVLIIMVLSGCPAGQGDLTIDASPFTFASPYLPYIGKTQDEIIKGLKYTEKNFTHKQEDIIVMKDPVTIDGLDYTATLRFESTTEGNLLNKFSYICEFDAPGRESAHEFIKNIYNALIAQFGVPARQHEVYEDFTVKNYLEDDNTWLGNAGVYTELWLVSDDIDYPDPVIDYGKNDAWTLEGCVLSVKLYVKFTIKTVTIEVSYCVTSNFGSGIIFD